MKTEEKKPKHHRVVKTIEDFATLAISNVDLLRFLINKITSSKITLIEQMVYQVTYKRNRDQLVIKGFVPTVESFAESVLLASLIPKNDVFWIIHASSFNDKIHPKEKTAANWYAIGDKLIFPDGFSEIGFINPTGVVQSFGLNI